MEQTQNTFTSGLQMDTHPMQQGQDSLTDALNATFVTMNGNEIVLQNDMGNARVQNAYLPKGYVPVGMKEYGGVIYVASYNPLTDRGQIGSFPSPQRRFFDVNSGYGDFKPETLFLNNDPNNYHLKNRVGLIPLNTDTILRAGDKFIIYSENLAKYFGLISNWENIYENENIKKIDSPKNRYFTLSVGVLNSRNEFVDITKTLMRFEYKDEDKKGKVISFDSLDSEQYKFNKGYFIAPLNTAEESDILPEADSYLEKVRALDKLDLNTYAYKLIGPLYLKAELNCPTDFDYSLTGYTEGNEAKLKLTYKFTYNCPDGIGLNPKNVEGDQTYYNYYHKEFVKNFFGCQFKYGQNLEDFSGESSTQNVYDPVMNTYTVFYEKELTIPITNNEEDTGSILYYELTPKMKYWGDDQYFYLDDLKQEGYIDLSKLGSGKMKLRAWRFYNDVENRKTAITYIFDAYPKENHIFRNVKFNFSEITNSGRELGFIRTYRLDDDLGYNGLSDIVIDWDEAGLDFRKLYQVKITWEDYDQIEESYESDEDYRWILTTKLFNECYFQNEDSFMIDFCNPQGEQENQTFERLNTIIPEIRYSTNVPTVKEKISYEFGHKTYTSNVNIYSNDGSEYDVNGYWGYSNQFEIRLNSKITVYWDESLYPDFIKEQTPALITVYLDEIKDQLSEDYGDVMSTNPITKGVPEFNEQQSGNFDLDILTYAYTKDRIKGPLKSCTMHYCYEFDTLQNILSSDPYCNEQFVQQGGINLLTFDSGGNDTFHAVNVSVNDEDEKGLFWRDDLEKVPGLTEYLLDYSKGKQHLGASYYNSQPLELDATSKKVKDNDYSFNYKDIENYISYNITNALGNLNMFVLTGISVFRNGYSVDQGGNNNKKRKRYWPFQVTWIRTDEAKWVLYDIKELDSSYSSGYYKEDDNKTETYTLNYTSLFKEPEKFIVATHYDRNGQSSDNNFYKIDKDRAVSNPYYTALIYYPFNITYI